jgi:hypothetical protein
MMSMNFFPNDPVPPVTSTDSCDQFTMGSLFAPSLAHRRHKPAAIAKNIANFARAKFLCPLV